MLLGFELVGLGIPINSLSSGFEFSDLSMFSLSFVSPLTDDRPHGIIEELLHVPFISNTSALQPPHLCVSHEPIVDLLLVPLLGLCFAYVVIVVAFKIALVTELPTKVEEVIPQKVFCFRAIDLPEIVLAPPRVSELPDFRRSDLWEGVAEMEKEEMVVEVTRFSPYLAPGSDLELFCPVELPVWKLPGKGKRSFFSS
jgi:hypothetical protein